MRETVVESYLRTEVERHGGLCVKMSPGGGWPDRLVLFPGEAFLIELKKPRGGVVSAPQVINHRRLEALGFHVELLSTKNAVDTFGYAATHK